MTIRGFRMWGLGIPGFRGQGTDSFRTCRVLQGYEGTTVDDRNPALP